MPNSFLTILDQTLIPESLVWVYQKQNISFIAAWFWKNLLMSGEEGGEQTLFAQIDPDERKERGME